MAARNLSFLSPHARRDRSLREESLISQLTIKMLCNSELSVHSIHTLNKGKENAYQTCIPQNILFLVQIFDLFLQNYGRDTCEE